MKGAAVFRRRRDGAVKVAPGDCQRRLLHVTSLFDDVDDVRSLSCAHHGTRRFDNPCLFPGNGRKGVTQNLRVLQFDGGDCRDLWREHVGRVQTTAKPDLHDCNVNVLTRKIQKAKGGIELEERELASGPKVDTGMDVVSQLGGQSRKVLGADPLPIDLGALANAHEMRTAKEAGAKSGAF